MSFRFFNRQVIAALQAAGFNLAPGRDEERTCRLCWGDGYLLGATCQACGGSGGTAIPPHTEVLPAEGESKNALSGRVKAALTAAGFARNARGRWVLIPEAFEYGGGPLQLCGDCYTAGNYSGLNPHPARIPHCDQCGRQMWD